MTLQFYTTLNLTGNQFLLWVWKGWKPRWLRTRNVIIRYGRIRIRKDVINLRRPQTRKGCHPYAKKNAALLAREFSTVSACQRVMRPMTLASFRKLSDALLLVAENDSWLTANFYCYVLQPINSGMVFSYRQNINWPSLRLWLGEVIPGGWRKSMK